MKKFYDKGIEHFGNGEISLLSDNISAALIDTTQYSVSIAADEYLSDIPATAILSTTLFTGKNNIFGAFTADDIEFLSVEGAYAGAIVIYNKQATDQESMLIAYSDGKNKLTIAANAVIGSTELIVEQITIEIANGQEIELTGGEVIILSATALAGDRNIFIIATSQEISSGDYGYYFDEDCELPVIPDGSNIQISFGTGREIFAL